MSEAKVRGKVVTAALDSVKPNAWNPNIVPEHKMRALERAMREEGWLASQALLIWRTDKEGAKQNVIIDGEHRWMAARAVGITSGPMVFLDGLSVAEAKALTIKVDNIRGQFDNDALGVLLREIQSDIGELEAVCGFDTAEWAVLLNTAHNEAPSASETGAFLDQFDPKPTRGSLQNAAPAQDDSLFAFSLRLTAEQDRELQNAIKQAKKTFNVSTNVEALFAIFRAFMKGKHNV